MLLAKIVIKHSRVQSVMFRKKHDSKFLPDQSIFVFQHHWLSTRFSGKRCRYEYYSGVDTSFPVLDRCASGVDTFQSSGQKYAKMSNTVRFIGYNFMYSIWLVLNIMLFTK